MAVCVGKASAMVGMGADAGHLLLGPSEAMCALCSRDDSLPLNSSAAVGNCCRACLPSNPRPNPASNRQLLHYGPKVGTQEPEIKK